MSKATQDRTTTDRVWRSASRLAAPFFFHVGHAVEERHNQHPWADRPRDLWPPYALVTDIDILEDVSFSSANGLDPDLGVTERLAQSDVVVSLTVGAMPGVGSERPKTSRDVIETYQAICG